MITRRPDWYKLKQFRDSGKSVVQALIFLVTPKQNEVRFGVTRGLVVPELAEGGQRPHELPTSGI